MLRYLAAALLLIAASAAATGLLPVPAAPQPDEPERAPESVYEAADPLEVDTLIEQQLGRRFALVPGLEDVLVSSTAGVVTLRGEVAEEGDRELAETLARGVEEVVDVRNRVDVSFDLATRLEPAAEAAVERLQRLVAATPLLLVALLLVALFAWFGRWLARREHLFRRVAHNPFLATLLRQVLRTALLLVGVLVALDLLGATALVGAVLGTAGLVGLALGFAFRDLVENYIASVLLSLRQPFAPNDHVVIEGHEGRVVSLNSRATTLMTLEGNHLRLPNATVFKSVMLNYTRNPRRQFHFTVGIGTGEDLARAQQVGVDVLRAMRGVLDDPEPFAAVMELAESSVTVQYFAWIDQAQTSWLKARSEGIRLVKEGLEAAGIELPEPIHRIRLQTEEPAERERSTAARADARAIAARQADVSAGYELEQQIASERAQPHERERDLLDPNAPRE